jgi:hypothetical protein
MTTHTTHGGSGRTHARTTPKRPCSDGWQRHRLACAGPRPSLSRLRCRAAASTGRSTPAPEAAAAAAHNVGGASSRKQAPARPPDHQHCSSPCRHARRAPQPASPRALPGHGQPCSYSCAAPLAGARAAAAAAVRGQPVMALIIAQPPRLWHAAAPTQARAGVGARSGATRPKRGLQHITTDTTCLTDTQLFHRHTHTHTTSQVLAQARLPPLGCGRGTRNCGAAAHAETRAAHDCRAWYVWTSTGTKTGSQSTWARQAQAVAIACKPRTRLLETIV